MNDCKMFPKIDCPCSEFCANRAECSSGAADNLPFLKELFCLHTTLCRLAKYVCDSQTKVPTFTYNETLNQALWLFRGAIEKAAKSVFQMGDIQHNFATFDKCVTMWENTIRETEANFLREAFLPLRSQIRIHDWTAKGCKGDIFFSN